ncbi:hypothetical protein EHQ13_04285 [Leptospira gomenensis]|uniref:SGNH/GDSL hydrolase family protein n=1 Tax=Leptospira gomenensis TaxID=2484974 RepID=A0A5F1Z1E4_9LEPT|nr:hypothetical protein [Leptospira gomenensis]TGK30921.1 hypothetical protein EHQ17_14445 [Leptospira gomenensis]TGK45359.1 hypothetical protein EHQ07_10550 [Leptospira gomenensis]TGK66272.1 hypothetical protein EHQ13_04285 [Leptospira gomenensis]
MFKYPIGMPNSELDFLFKTNSHSFEDLDYFCLFDSRGSNLNGNAPGFAELLNERFRIENKRYLTICRPIEITVFFSLLNILKENKIRARTLISNVGFVDCTPKKKSIIEDIILQGSAFFSSDQHEYEIQELEDYTLSNGEIQKLNSLNFDEFTADIANALTNKFETIYLIKTLELDFSRKFKRERPRSFYSQLVKTNDLLKNVANNAENIRLISVQSEMEKTDNHLDVTYDGVHFTNETHKSVGNRILEHLFQNKSN